MVNQSRRGVLRAKQSNHSNTVCKRHSENNRVQHERGAVCRRSWPSRRIEVVNTPPSCHHRFGLQLHTDLMARRSLPLSTLETGIAIARST